jgi:hypothetical protein
LKIAIAAVVTLAAVLGAPSALAQAHDTAAAEAAFAEARTLMRQGKYAEACPKLETSFTLDPALGTLMNLSDCFERTGRTASAWVRYREAAAMAVQQGHREREAIARERVAALEPGLCRLVIRTEHGPGLSVVRDGKVVDRAALGLPVPVDPGAHAVIARAGGGELTANIDVRPPAPGEPCALSTVEIPARLEGEQASPAPPAAGDGAPPPPSATRWRTSHTLAVVVASAGVVALGVGTVFTVKAAGQKSDGNALCTSAGCSPEGQALLHDAGSSADAATVSVIVGAALVATGAVLWLTSPSLRSAVATLADGGSLRF